MSKSKKKNEHAVALGLLGASKGGKARAVKLSKSRRSEIAKKAALARWNKREGIVDEDNRTDKGKVCDRR